MRVNNYEGFTMDCRGKIRVISGSDKKCDMSVCLTFQDMKIFPFTSKPEINLKERVPMEFLHDEG